MKGVYLFSNFVRCNHMDSTLNFYCVISTTNFCNNLIFKNGTRIATYKSRKYRKKGISNGNLILSSQWLQRDLFRRFLVMKSILALVLGFILGYFKVTGILGFMVFIPFQYISGQFYCTQFKVPDYLMDKGEMFTTQCLPSFGLFLVCV